MIIGMICFLLSGIAAVAQTASGPTFWAHTFPGQSSPGVIGYGVPPVGRGPAFRYSSSATDVALMQGLVTMAQPFLRHQQGGRIHSHDANEIYAQSFMNTDPYQGAFGTAPGWSAPFDIAPTVSSSQIPAAAPRGVFMP
jgi:hypothetical protein